MSSRALPSRPLIKDPRAVAVVGTDAHLPALPAEQLHVDWLRQRLVHAHLQAPAIPGDGARRPEEGRDPDPADAPPRPASVLVPLVRRPEGLQLLLTRRTDHLHDHAGQISFPGGRAEPTDADAVATALREAEEEVGLRPAEVEVIGRLPTYTTVTRYLVTPVVGLVSPPYTLRLDPFEVAEAFEVPLHFLMTPAHHRRHEVTVEQVRRQFLSMPWTRDASRPDEYFIWGATAAMLRNLYHVLAR